MAITPTAVILMPVLPQLISKAPLVRKLSTAVARLQDTHLITLLILVRGLYNSLPTILMLTVFLPIRPVLLTMGQIIKT